MGYAAPITGRIDTVTPRHQRFGCNPEHARSGERQRHLYLGSPRTERVPVRIRITHVPPDVPMIAGLTATVFDREGEPRPNGVVHSQSMRQAVQQRGRRLRDAATRPWVHSPDDRR